MTIYTFFATFSTVNKATSICLNIPSFSVAMPKFAENRQQGCIVPAACSWSFSYYLLLIKCHQCLRDGSNINARVCGASLFSLHIRLFSTIRHAVTYAKDAFLLIPCKHFPYFIFQHVIMISPHILRLAGRQVKNGHCDIYCFVPALLLQQLRRCILLGVVHIKLDSKAPWYLFLAHEITFPYGRVRIAARIPLR